MLNSRSLSRFRVSTKGLDWRYNSVMITRASVLDRIVQAGKDLPPHIAEYLLSLKLPADAHLRYEELSAKAQDGALGEDETIELDDLLTANDVLMILHSKARASLGRRSPAA